MRSTFQYGNEPIGNRPKPITMSAKTMDKKSLRAIGHRLRPVVTVAQNGASEPVRNEIDRALNDHELIKVKFQGIDRTRKAAVIQELTASLGADCVQQIGHVVLLFRAAEAPNPKLSNLLRSFDQKT